MVITPKYVGAVFNFNVNFKIVFKTVHSCISWWMKNFACVNHFVITPALREACSDRLKWLGVCSVLVIHLAVGTAGYLNKDNLTCSDNCHVSCSTVHFYAWAIEFCLRTSPNIFPLISLSLTFVPDILRTHRLKIYLFSPLFLVLFSADVTFSSLIRVLSFSCSHFPISFFLPADTHIYASRQANRTIHPLQHWNCPQARLVRKHAVAFTSLLYTHIPPTPRLPPPSFQTLSVRPSACLSVCILPITCLSMFKLDECTCVCVWRYGLFLWQLGTPYCVGGCCSKCLGGEKTF
jgi:hypothetical protein